MPAADVLLRAREALEADPGSACLLDRDGRIVHCNAAWDRFALENAAPPALLARKVAGTAWLAGITGGELRAHFEGVLRQTLAGKLHTQPGECNSPELWREVASHFVPVRDEAAVVGASVVCSVLRVAPIGAAYELQPPDEARYGTLVRMCSGCRRVARLGEPVRWDFVPAFLGPRAPPITHGLCPTCMTLLYGL